MKKDNYSPMYFLSALGAGGLAISFFMYLTFLIPHKGYPVVTFGDIYPYLMQGDFKSIFIGLILIAILTFVFYHFKLLFWNISQFKQYKITKELDLIKKTNTEVTLMAIPLTLAMTINVSFVAAIVFIPNLWSIIEYIFPFALIAMSIAGYYTIKIFGIYAMRVIVEGGFNFEVNNNLSQLIAVFAFVMVAVSFAAPGAMSHNIIINAVGVGFAIFFLSLAFMLLVPKFLFGLDAIIRKGVGEEASPSLWILIPILTLIGISMVRIDMSLAHNFENEIINTSMSLTQTSIFVTSTVILSLQIVFGLAGYFVMKKLNYFKDYVYGDKKSPVVFALICPGVSFMVFGMFFINFGLIFNGIIDQYSIASYIMMIPFVYVQFLTVKLFFKLKNKFAI